MMQGCLSIMASLFLLNFSQPGMLVKTCTNTYQLPQPHRQEGVQSENIENIEKK
jgi:hypothetical protein